MRCVIGGVSGSIQDFSSLVGIKSREQEVSRAKYYVTNFVFSNRIEAGKLRRWSCYEVVGEAET